MSAVASISWEWQFPSSWKYVTQNRGECFS